MSLTGTRARTALVTAGPPAWLLIESRRVQICWEVASFHLLIRAAVRPSPKATGQQGFGRILRTDSRGRWPRLFDDWRRPVLTMPDVHGERRRNPGRPRSCATQEDDVRPVTSTSVRTARSRSDPPAQRGERHATTKPGVQPPVRRSQRTAGAAGGPSPLEVRVGHVMPGQYTPERVATDALSAPVAMFSIQSSDLCPTAAAQLDRAVAHGRDRGSAGALLTTTAYKYGSARVAALVRPRRAVLSCSR